MVFIFTLTWGDNQIWVAYVSNGWFNHHIENYIWTKMWGFNPLRLVTLLGSSLKRNHKSPSQIGTTFTGRCSGLLSAWGSGIFWNVMTPVSQHGTDERSYYHSELWGLSVSWWCLADLANSFHGVASKQNTGPWEVLWLFGNLLKVVVSKIFRHFLFRTHGKWSILTTVICFSIELWSHHQPALWSALIVSNF